MLEAHVALRDIRISQNECFMFPPLTQSDSTSSHLQHSIPSASLLLKHTVACHVGLALPWPRVSADWGSRAEEGAN